jgi:hypothetical protein
MRKNQTALTEVQAFVRDLDGSNSEPVALLDLDPRFVAKISGLSSQQRQMIRRGNALVLSFPDSRAEERKIVGVTSADTAWEIIAPRRISAAKPDGPFVVAIAEGGTSVELRAGSTFIGDRGSGFFDGEGIILQAEHIGGDVKLWEDWAYYVVGPSWYREHAPQWILLKDIRGACNAPSSIFKFPFSADQDIDGLLRSGEDELLKYFASHPERLGEVDGRYNVIQWDVGAVSLYARTRMPPRFTASRVSERRRCPAGTL